MRIEQLVALFTELSHGAGVELGKLDERPKFLDLLGTPGKPEAGLRKLDELLDGLGEKQVRAVRTVLAVGRDPEGNHFASHGSLINRRKWAAGEGNGGTERYFGGSVSTLTRAEKKGFRELALLILERAEARSVEEKSNQFTIVPPARLEPDDRDSESAAIGVQPSIFYALGWRCRHLKEAAVQWAGSLGNSTVATGALLFGLAGILAILAAMVESDSGSIQPKAAESARSHVVPDGVATDTPEAAISAPSQPKIESVHGWGPERKTFTTKDPVPYPVFNSVTNNPDYGDERNFMMCRGQKDNDWSTELVAFDGRTYKCRIWFSNSAYSGRVLVPGSDQAMLWANLEKALGRAHVNRPKELQNARVQVQIPGGAIYNPAVVGMLMADNSTTVWASCKFIASLPVEIAYVRGSARMFTSATPEDGLPLAETYEGGIMNDGIRASGALLGDGKQDGYVGENGGYVHFEVAVSLGSK